MIIIIIYSGLIRLVTTTPCAGPEIARGCVHPGQSPSKPCTQPAINPASCTLHSYFVWSTATHKIKIHCKPLPGPCCGPGRSAKFSSQHWELSCARSTGGEGNRVVQCHIITESPVTDPAAPGFFFHFGPDFTAHLLPEEELKREAALSCSHQNQTECWPRQQLVSLPQL